MNKNVKPIILVLFSYLLISSGAPSSKQPGRYSPYTGTEYDSGTKNSLNLLFYPYPDSLLTYYDINFKLKKSSLNDSITNNYYECLYSNITPSTIFPPADPYNCTYMGNNLWMDKTEISNIAYIEFLESIKKDSSMSYFQSMKIKSSLKVKSPLNLYLSQELLGLDIDERDSSLIFTHYWNHPTFLFHPVVDITFEQVQEFCKWRSKVATYNYNKTYATPNTYYELKYRLPTNLEWENATPVGCNTRYDYGIIDTSLIHSPARINEKMIDYFSMTAKEQLSDDEIEEKIKRINKNKIKVPVINCFEQQKSLFDSSFPDYVYSNPPNDFGLFNIYGNVSEMTAEPNVAYGGNWKSQLTDCTFKSRLTYSNKSNQVGFRCVCEISKIDK